MIRIEMLAAEYGDCLLVEYGTHEDPHRLLVDGGLASTYEGPLRTRLGAIGSRAPPSGPAARRAARRGPSPSAGRCPLELLVITHVDDDHLGGILTLLQKAAADVTPHDVWFNAYRHIAQRLGPEQGDLLSDRLTELRGPWNAASPFRGGAVVVPPTGPLPVVKLAGDARIVLLSPGRRQLDDLVPVWDETIAKAKLRRDGRVVPERRLGGAGEELLGKRKPLHVILPDAVPKLASDVATPDTSEANGSSIAFILEHAGAKVLLCGDAHPGVLVQGLRRYGGGGAVALDAVKLPHHGSRHNVTAELLDAFTSPRYLVSTNGERFGHPDPEAVARIAMRPGRKQLYFNYESDYTRPWGAIALADRYALGVAFGRDGRSVVEIASA